MHRVTRLLGIILLCGISLRSAAQESSPHDSSAQVSRGDTSAGATGGWRFLGADSVQREIKAPKSTTTAVLLSAVLPGAGQFYNGSYWKVPVFAGLGIYLGYQLLDNQKKYSQYSDLYSQSQEEIPGGDPRYFSLREFYRKERDRFGWYFLLFYVVNLVDAYVDASLSDFDIGDDVSLELLPGPATTPLGIGLKVKF